MLARYVRGLQSRVLSTRLQGRNIGPRSSPSNTSTVSVVVAVSRSFGFGARSWMETQTLDLGMEFESNKISNLCTGHKNSPVKVKIRHFTDRRRKQCISLTLPTPPHFRSYFLWLVILFYLKLRVLCHEVPCWISSDQYERVRAITPNLTHLLPIHTWDLVTLTSHMTPGREKGWLGLIWKCSLRGVLTCVASGLDINGCVLSYFKGTVHLHCYTSCTLTTLHCSKV